MGSGCSEELGGWCGDAAVAPELWRQILACSHPPAEGPRQWAADARLTCAQQVAPTPAGRAVACCGLSQRLIPVYSVFGGCLLTAPFGEQRTSASPQGAAEAQLQVEVTLALCAAWGLSGEGVQGPIEAEQVKMGRGGCQARERSGEPCVTRVMC